MVDQLIGALRINDKYYAFEIWHILNTNAKLWEQYHKLPSRFKNRDDIDVECQNMLQSFTSFPSDRWHTLCTAAGWTVYGAVALSWCQDVQISQVWDGWEASGFLLKPLPEYERPAHFINPALLPQTSSLSQIVNICPDKSLPICATIAALKSPLEFDLPVENLKTANPQLASFLKSRMQQKSGRTAEEDELIQVWSQTVSGTEWEV